MIPHQSIKGYNLSKYNKKRKFQIKRCWACGSTNHLIADCPVHRETQLRKRVSELEDRVQELEAALLNQINNRKKRERRKRKKLHRKKKKKHQKKVKAMMAAVKIKEYLLKEEQSREGIDILKGATYLYKIPRKDKERVLKEYKELFGGDCALVIVEAFCNEEDYIDFTCLRRRRYRSRRSKCLVNTH